MNPKGIIEKINKTIDELEHEAAVRLNEQQAYHSGYVQACEDFGRRLRGSIILEENTDN